MSDVTYGISELVNRSVLIVSCSEEAKPDLDLKYMLAQLGDGSQLVCGSEGVCTQLRALKLPQRVTIRRDIEGVFATYHLERA